MKRSSAQITIRILAFAVLLAAAASCFMPPGKNAVAVKHAFSLDLTPNITKGLDLVGVAGFEHDNGSNSDNSDGGVRIGVFGGEELMKMTLRDYLIGVTAAEMPAGYGIEALKAQAVAARTFTLKHMTGELKCKSGHTVCTDHRCCQAYISIERMKKNWGEGFEEKYNKICEAVDGTAGLVMTSEGELVTALYHSSSGGKTENCEAVFAVALPYLVSVESGGEEASPEFQTTVCLSKKDFAERINAAFPDAMIEDPAKDVDVWQRTESGRIALIRLGGTVVSGQQLRNALELKSTNVEFEFEDGEVRISCLGFGHGVGMSQVGANAMAAEGADYETILTHYYTGVKIEHYKYETDLLAILSAADAESKAPGDETGG